MRFLTSARFLALALTWQQGFAASSVVATTATDGDINFDALATIKPDGTGAPVGTATAGPSIDLKSLTSAIAAQAQTTDLSDYTTISQAQAAPTFITTSLLFNTKYGPAFPTGRPKKAVQKRDFRGMTRRTTYFYDTSKAAIPVGYRSAFTSLSGATQGKGYLTYKSLKTYDTAACATFCTSNKLCSFFNIYYERDPDAKGNPVDMIKCSIYSLPQTDATATNKGQWRGTFQILITGSNGYNKVATQTAPTGYNLTDLGNGALDAPTYDKTGGLTSIKQVMIEQYSAALCASACDAQTAAAKASDTTGCAPNVCVSANLYILSKNGKPFTTVCSLYTTAWNSTFATNSGYTDSGDSYAVSNSITITSTANAASYPKLCTNPAPSTLVPKTLGGATLGSIPAPAVPEYGLQYMAIGSYSNYRVGAPLVSSFENIPTDHLAYYPFPSSSSKGCISQGYIYHVESGLCATQTQVSASSPMWGSSASNAGATTLQPCNIDSDTSAPVAQSYCLAGDLHDYYKGFDGFSYDCLTFKGDTDVVDAYDQGWIGLEHDGVGKRPKGAVQGDYTFEAGVSTDGAFCFWVKTRELGPAEPDVPSDDGDVD